MKKNVFKFMGIAFCGVLLSATFASCSQDDEESPSRTTAKGDAIAFSTTVDNAGSTRAIPTTAANFLTRVQDFKVWGTLVSDGNYYLGGTGDAGILIDNKGEGKWDYHNALDLVYWPKEAMNFYAVTPSSDENYTFSGSSLTYVVPTDQSKQVDLMVANADNQTKTTNSGTVALQFKHMLSQVVFKGVNKNSNLSVEIQSIAIHNVNSTLVTTLSNGTSVARTPATYTAYSAGIGTPKTVATTDATAAVTLSDDDGALLLAPQTITGWADNTTITAADQANQCYLEITCKISSKTSSGVSYLIGTETAYDKTYIALPVSWEAGKRYVYTLQFGGGKKQDGTDQFEPISFSVSVDDWTDSASSISL